MLVSIARPGKYLAARCKRTVDDIADIDPVALRIDRAGLDPRHVEQVGDEARQPVALLLDRGEQVGAAGRLHLVAELAQAGDRAGDRRQRRLQIVRDRRQKRRAEPLAFELGRLVEAFLGKPRAVDGDRRLVENGAQHLLLGCIEHLAGLAEADHRRDARRTSPSGRNWNALLGKVPVPLPAGSFFSMAQRAAVMSVTSSSVSGGQAAATASSPPAAESSTTSRLSDACIWVTAAQMTSSALTVPDSLREKS